MGNFRTLVRQQSQVLEGGAKSDLMRKYSCLVAFDFEAAVRLKAWASLKDLIDLANFVEADQESVTCADDNVYSIMVDIILASEAPIEVVIATLQVGTTASKTAKALLNDPANRQPRVASRH
ncbi:MAG: hypothetical protein Q9168_002789 [Polycauliona sp. 1 TL-2023]